MLRLRQMAIVAHDRDATVAALQAAFGLGDGYDDPHIGQLGLHNAVLPVGDQFIEVVAPVSDGTTAGRYLARRGGDAGYMLIFQTDDHAARSARVEALGVRVVARFDAPDFTNMQLHPADTGGAFFEIDQQDDDGWSPAGTQWRDHVHTDVVDGIVGATIACADPAAVAARWADLLGLSEPADGADGAATIATDEATIHFVAEADPARQGIVAVELRATRGSAEAPAPAPTKIGGVEFTVR